MGSEPQVLKPLPPALCDWLESGAFSGVLCVVLDGRSVLEFVHGVADLQGRRPNDLATRFAAGSVSKMFTAVCMGRLVDAGLCRFDQSLAEIVPALGAHFGLEVTIASLLSHRSGLGDYLDDDKELCFEDMDLARLDRPEAFLPLVLGAPRYAPGEFRYSSGGYILLGLAIEALTGQSFAGAMEEWVMAPAGLRATGFPSLHDPPVGVAIGRLTNGLPNLGHLPVVGGPDGGLVTCLEDVRRFFGALGSGALLSESTRQFLWEPVSVVSATECYGHGFEIVTRCGRTWYGHGGSDPGVSARVAFDPKSGSSIVALCNARSIAFRAFRMTLEWLEAG